jgi:hypothetical protein
MLGLAHALLEAIDRLVLLDSRCAVGGVVGP